MKTKGIPIRNQGRRPKQLPSLASVPHEIQATGRIIKGSRLRAAKPQGKNGEGVFDAEAFLTQAGMGNMLLNLQKEATIALVGADSSNAQIRRCARVAASGACVCQKCFANRIGPGESAHTQAMIPAQDCSASLQVLGRLPQPCK